jgi:hypothetical protein
MRWPVEQQQQEGQQQRHVGHGVNMANDGQSLPFSAQGEGCRQ